MTTKVQCPAVFKVTGAQPTSQSGPDPTEPTALETEEVQGVRGLLCTQEVKPREVICAIPNKLIISAATARNSEIAEVLRNHEELFVTQSYREEQALRLFVMHERNKGPSSFWHEWFEVAQLVDLPYTWEDPQVDQLVDVELRSRLRYDAAQMAKEWTSLKAVIKLYEPKFFGENEAGVPMSENEGLFHWACNFLASRAFGTSLGAPWLCPLIDLCNHEPGACTMVDIIHTKLHLAESKIYMHDPHFSNLLKRARLASTSTTLQSEDRDLEEEESLAEARDAAADLELFRTGSSRRMQHSVTDLYDHYKIPLDDK